MEVKVTGGKVADWCASEGDDRTWLEHKAVTGVADSLRVTRAEAQRSAGVGDQEEPTAGVTSGL